ncbi:MAG: NADPH-dependent FMN reductase, partial [Clostridiales bacterium]|nr:NADPH-dependent FMN reductase [Clostridiales bacterium]
AALKNALDYVYAEWNNKAVGFVGYGSAQGVRAVEHLRQIVGELQMADVRTAVQLSLFTDFTDNASVFKPADLHLESLDTMLTQLNAWAGALKPLRQ